MVLTRQIQTFRKEWRRREAARRKEQLEQDRAAEERVAAGMAMATVALCDTTPLRGCGVTKRCPSGCGLGCGLRKAVHCTAKTRADPGISQVVIARGRMPHV
jgi:hypothetical protein